MRVCGYGKWQAVRRRRCRRPATFLAKTPRERQLCSHHAAIAQALGWQVQSLEDVRIVPQFIEPQGQRLRAATALFIEQGGNY